MYIKRGNVKIKKIISDLRVNFHIATFYVHSVVTIVISIFPTYKFNF